MRLLELGSEDRDEIQGGRPDGSATGPHSDTVDPACVYFSSSQHGPTETHTHVVEDVAPCRLGLLELDLGVDHCKIVNRRRLRQCARFYDTVLVGLSQRRGCLICDREIHYCLLAFCVLRRGLRP